ncbi:transposase [Cryobacterium sp. Y11]
MPNPTRLPSLLFVRRHWRQIWSTNPPERVNEEIERRRHDFRCIP